MDKFVKVFTVNGDQVMVLNIYSEEYEVQEVTTTIKYGNLFIEMVNKFPTIEEATEYFESYGLMNAVSKRLALIEMIEKSGN